MASPHHRCLRRKFQIGYKTCPGRQCLRTTLTACHNHRSLSRPTMAVFSSHYLIRSNRPQFELRKAVNRNLVSNHRSSKAIVQPKPLNYAAELSLLIVKNRVAGS